MAIKVVTDSTADLPADVAKDLAITVVPLNVHFGEETFKDGVDMHPEEFFDRLVNEPILPKTSQPSVGVFLDTYRSLLEEGHDVVSIHVSSKLSGTVNSANQAHEQSGAGERIVVVDSLQVGIALGNVVTAVAEVVRGGASKTEAVDAAYRFKDQVSVYLLVETLEYLQKGGRLGKAQAFLGSLLQVRPILSVKDGEVHPLERSRTRKKAIERLYQLASGHGFLNQVAICHSTTPSDALELEERLKPFLADGSKVVQTRFGPVVGTYVGPGALGIAVRAVE